MFINRSHSSVLRLYAVYITGHFLIRIEGLSSVQFLADLVYQSNSLIQSCLVQRRWHRHCWYRQCCHRHHLCTSLCRRVRHRNFIFGIHMHICTYICTSNIQWFWLVVFKWQPFWCFSLICCPAQIDSNRDFILHILMYLFFTFTHKRNNATVTFFQKFMNIFLK